VSDSWNLPCFRFACTASIPEQKPDKKARDIYDAETEYVVIELPKDNKRTPTAEQCQRLEQDNAQPSEIDLLRRQLAEANAHIERLQRHNEELSAKANRNSGRSNHHLQDYQMQLNLLEQQNKKRLELARREQENGSGSGDGPPFQQRD